MLDGLFYENSNQSGSTQTDHAFGLVAKEIEFRNTNGNYLPWFILSGQANFVKQEHSLVKLLGNSSFGNGKVFNKLDDYEDELFNGIVDAIEASPVFRLKLEYKYVFKSATDEYLGSIIKLCEEKRGLQKNLSYSGNRAVLKYELPLNEVVFDFYDRLKSISSGYASFDYEITDYKDGDLIKLSVLLRCAKDSAHTCRSSHTNFATCEALKRTFPLPYTPLHLAVERIHAWGIPGDVFVHFNLVVTLSLLTSTSKAFFSVKFCSQKLKFCANERGSRALSIAGNTSF